MHLKFETLPARPALVPGFLDSQAPLQWFAEDACCPLLEESLHCDAAPEAAEGRLSACCLDSHRSPQQQLPWLWQPLSGWDRSLRESNERWQLPALSFLPLLLRVAATQPVPTGQ